MKEITLKTAYYFPSFGWGRFMAYGFFGMEIGKQV